MGQERPVSTWKRLMQAIERDKAKIVFDGGNHLFEGLDQRVLRFALREMFLDQAQLEEDGILTPQGELKKQAGERVLAAMEKDECVPVEQALLADLSLLSYKCKLCGQYGKFRFDGRSFRCEASCSIDADGPFTFELNVPSGLLVMKADLRDIFYAPTDEFDITCLMGGRATTRAYENIGCAHANIAGAGSGVYRLPGGDGNAFLIGHVNGEEHEGEFQLENVVRVMIGDLWWFSIADADEYVRRGGSLEDGDLRRLSVKPGVYRFTHRGYDPAYCVDEVNKYLVTLFEWVRPPDPLRDFIAEERALHLTAGQLLEAVLRHEFEGKESCIAGAVNNLFYDSHRWHVNGFPLAALIGADAPERAFPSLDERVYWHSLSTSAPEDCALIRIARGLQPANASFLELTRRVLTCIVTHGIKIIEESVPNAEALAAEEAELVALAREALTVLEARLASS